MAIIPAEEKVFMVSNSTNTTYSGSAALKAMQQWYTMEDVTNTVRPYQVFTALLTQSGGDDPQYQQLGSLIIGRTYEIGDNGVVDWDFTNVGAPNNDIGTYFVATGTTPANWGQNGVLNFNTGAPVATVLENTIGNIWFIYSAEGSYSIISDGLFIDNKTTTFGSQYNQDTGVFVYFQTTNAATTNEIPILTGDGAPADGYLQRTPIEIRVYN